MISAHHPHIWMCAWKNIENICVPWEHIVRHFILYESSMVELAPQSIENMPRFFLWTKSTCAIKCFLVKVYTLTIHKVIRVLYRVRVNGESTSSSNIYICQKWLFRILSTFCSQKCKTMTIYYVIRPNVCYMIML